MTAERVADIADELTEKTLERKTPPEQDAALTEPADLLFEVRRDLLPLGKFLNLIGGEVSALFYLTGIGAGLLQMIAAFLVGGSNIPIIGGLFSGTLSYIAFTRMSNRLNALLFELAQETLPS